jgi:hypothetical protein
MKLIWYPGDGSDPITFPDTVDGVTYILTKNYTGFSGAPVTHQTGKSPNQHGESYFGTVFEPRKISFEVKARTDTLQDLLDQQRETLVSMFDISRGVGTLVWEQEDGTQYLLYCIANGECPASLPGERGNTFQKYTFPMIAHDPFWYSGAPFIQYFNFTTKSFFPFNFPFNFQRSQSPFKTITNAGTHDTPVYVKFTGPMTNPVMTNNRTGKTITLAITLAAGETFELDSDVNDLYATYNATGGTENGYPYISSPTTLSEFLLKPGENPLQLSADSSGAGAEAMIQWSDKYAGV